MKKRGEITAFYIETLILIVVMIGILLVLTQILGLSRRESVRAKQLTEAVTIAQSAAEILSETEDLRQAAHLLGLEEISVTQEAEDTVRSQGILRFTHLKEGAVRAQTQYRVEVEQSVSGHMREDQISIYLSEGDEVLYSLTLRRVLKEEEAA